MTVGKLRRVALREVWKHEATAFTPWLEENIEILNEVIDLNVVGAEREKVAGDFSVDLVAEDEDGGTVVIENQLEASDHDHLGKLLTYIAALEAKAAIWIVACPRPEHVKAVTWLNETTETPFYLLQVEAVQIGDSEPAPLFTQIVGPSAEARAAGAHRAPPPATELLDPPLGACSREDTPPRRRLPRTVQLDRNRRRDERPELDLLDPAR